MTDKFEQTAQDLYDVNGDLSEADMLALLTSKPEGDTNKDITSLLDPAQPTAGTDDPKLIEEAKKDDPTTVVDPAATPQPNADPAAEPDGPKVVLAKDGVHTIDYSKLVEAREAAKSATAALAAAEAETQRLRAELTAAKAPAPPAPAPAAAPAAEADPAELFGDYSAEQLAKGVDALIEKKLSALRGEIGTQLAPVQRAAVEDANTKHYTAIYTAHPDADSIVQSTEFADWLGKQPRLVQGTYRQTLSPDGKGTAADVVEVFDAYRNAHPLAAAAPAPVAPPAQPGADVAAKAKAAIAAVKPKTPNTLSDIPAGAAAHVDEAEAIAGMDASVLMNRMASMKPDAIEALMSRML